MQALAKICMVRYLTTFHGKIHERHAKLLVARQGGVDFIRFISFRSG